MENNQTIPKPKDGFFTKIEDLHTFYKHKKEKYAAS